MSMVGNKVGYVIKEYKFTRGNLPQFNGFQIKIIMSGTNYAIVHKIRDLRAIASI